MRMAILCQIHPFLFFLLLRTLYGLISQYFLFFNKFGIILTFRGLFQAIESNKPSKIYMFLKIKGFLMK